MLVDALNEVAGSPSLHRPSAKVLLAHLPSSRVVISTRQEAYRNELVLPVYELQPLSSTKFILFFADTRQLLNQAISCLLALLVISD